VKPEDTPERDALIEKINGGGDDDGEAAAVAVPAQAQAGAGAGDDVVGSQP
jgi:hypothetical protein